MNHHDGRTVKQVVVVKVGPKKTGRNQGETSGANKGRWSPILILKALKIFTFAGDFLPPLFEDDKFQRRGS